MQNQRVHATYTNGVTSTKHDFTITDPTSIKYNTTNGKTTGPSEYVIKAGQEEDVDRPSEPKKLPAASASSSEYTFLSQVRMQLTGIQDDINDFLTEKMLEQRNDKKLKESE